MDFGFTWDPRKDAGNRRKHGVSFDEAKTAFADPLSLTVRDSEHSTAESRFLLVGRSQRGRLLVVAHAEVGDRFESSMPARRRAGNVMPTKKKRSAAKVRKPALDRDTMLPEYDFSGEVRGKYAARYPHGSIVVTLAPDVAAVYPSADAANDALRKLIRESGPRVKRRSA